MATLWQSTLTEIIPGKQSAQRTKVMSSVAGQSKGQLSIQDAAEPKLLNFSGSILSGATDRQHTRGRTVQFMNAHEQSLNGHIEDCWCHRNRPMLRRHGHQLYSTACSYRNQCYSMSTLLPVVAQHQL